MAKILSSKDFKTMQAILEEYQILCDEVYSLYLKENGILKESKAPEMELVQQKKKLLERLEAVLAQLKKLNTEGHGKASPLIQNIVQQLQQKLMKIFLVDRENEKLLLELQVNAPVKVDAVPVTAQKLRNLYETSLR